MEIQRITSFPTKGFVYGYKVRHADLRETLYAVCDDGSVRESDTHEWDDCFNRPTRVWNPVDGVPADAVHIGNYLRQF